VSRAFVFCLGFSERENQFERIGTLSEKLHQNLRFIQKELGIRDGKQEQA
jgi:hypothetical protein